MECSNNDGKTVRMAKAIVNQIDQRVKREGSSSDRKKWPAYLQWIVGILIVPTMGFIVLGYVSQEKIKTLTSRIDKLEVSTISREVLDSRYRAVINWQTQHKEDFNEFKLDTKEELRDAHR